MDRKKDRSATLPLSKQAHQSFALGTNFDAVEEAESVPFHFSPDKLDHSRINPVGVSTLQARKNGPRPCIRKWQGS
jgi:hypothetical protein